MDRDMVQELDTATAKCVLTIMIDSCSVASWFLSDYPTLIPQRSLSLQPMQELQLLPTNTDSPGP